jgi:hypothetical protein
MVSVFHRPRADIEEGSGASCPQGSGADIPRKEAKRLAHDGNRETEGCSYVGGPEVCWGRCVGGPVGGKRCVIGRGMEPKVEDAARGGAEQVRAPHTGERLAHHREGGQAGHWEQAVLSGIAVQRRAGGVLGRVCLGDVGRGRRCWCKMLPSISNGRPLCGLG